MTSESSDGVDYRVAQSGDATCNGLFSATEGSRTMTLTRGKLHQYRKLAVAEIVCENIKAIQRI